MNKSFEMFTIIEEIGPASWLLVREKDHVDIKSRVITRTYQYVFDLFIFLKPT